MDVASSNQQNLPQQQRFVHGVFPASESSVSANLPFTALNQTVNFGSRSAHISAPPIRQQLSFNGEEFSGYQHHPPNSSVLVTQKSLPEQLYPYYQVGDQLLPYSPMFNTNSSMTQRQQVPQMQQSQTKSLSRQPRQFDTNQSSTHAAYPSTSAVGHQPQQYSNQYQQHQSQTEVAPGSPLKRKEIYAYESTFPLFGMSWSTRPDYKFRLAVGSFIEEYNNKISIIQLREDYGGGEFMHLGTFDHPYPATKVLWIPDKKGTLPDLIATTGDYLRLWSVGGAHGASLEVMLDNNRSSNYCAPLTSADWNEVDPSLIACASIDTTCTIWSIETGQAITERKPTKGNVKTQLIAHDREVYDISFSKLNGGKDIFGSVGADGSVRMFDSRHMEFSMIVFEEPNRQPLLRLAFNQQDHNYLATFAHNSSDVFIIDIRIPSIPVATLKNHTGYVNAISWAPHSGIISCHICTTAEDKQALIWDVHNMPRPVEDPILAYTANGAINNVEWGSSLTDWISICYGRTLEILRV